MTAAGAEKLRDRLRTLIAMEENELLALIPVQTGFISCDCPNCDEGTQGSQLEWKIETPEVLTCRYCGHRYPSKKYPDDKVLEVKDPLGRIQLYHYYQDASGLKYFFEARRWRLERDYLEIASYELADLYHFTGERPLARKVALILDRFAQLYPGFIVVRESQQSDQGFQDHPPYQTQGGKWGRWYYDEVPTSLILAYDLIYSSGELERLAGETGAPVKRRIEADFFRGVVTHIRLYPEYYANPSPRIYEGMAVLGRVVAEPDFVHDAVRRIRGIFANSFMYDGVWKEGTFVYHNMTMEGLQLALDAVEDYSDPPGYTDANDHTRFDRLHLREQIPMFRAAATAMDRFCYPDGRPLPIHDSWARLHGEYVKHAALASSSPALWPAVGHAYLGRGKDADQMQVHLHFGGAYGHAHADSLNLILFAKGEELLPDIGYSHTRFRQWTHSTLGHNTVLVDGEEQYIGSAAVEHNEDWDRSSDGNLLMFGAAGDDFQVVEASGERGYPGRVDTYRRAAMLVGVDQANAYVVDVFRVAGGQRHEWILHGSADRDTALDLDTSLSPYGETLLPPGVKFTEPKMETETGFAGGHNPAYGFVRDVQRGVAPPVLVATFKPKLRDGACLRVHTLPPVNSEVLTGRAPSIRLADENDAKVDQFWTPILVIRKDGKDLRETYFSVIEPCGSRPVIHGIEQLQVNGGGCGARISGPDWTDYVVYRDEADAATEAVAGELRFQGRMAWVRERHGNVVAMALVGGTELHFGNRELKSFGTLTGRVKSVLRKEAGQAVNALEVDGQFPAAVELAGRTVIVHHHGNSSTHGYCVSELRSEHGRTLLVLAGEPGFELDANGKSQFLFFPKREIQGQVSYSLSDLVFFRA